MEKVNIEEAIDFFAFGRTPEFIVEHLAWRGEEDEDARYNIVEECVQLLVGELREMEEDIYDEREDDDVCLEIDLHGFISEQSFYHDYFSPPQFAEAVTQAFAEWRAYLDSESQSVPTEKINAAQIQEFLSDPQASRLLSRYLSWEEEPEEETRLHMVQRMIERILANFFQYWENASRDGEFAEAPFEAFVRCNSEMGEDFFDDEVLGEALRDAYGEWLG